jgi:hypothetical protein
VSRRPASIEGEHALEGNEIPVDRGIRRAAGLPLDHELAHELRRDRGHPVPAKERRQMLLDPQRDRAQRSLLVRAVVIQQLTGHKTRAVFERYNITSRNDLRDAARRLDAYAGAGSRGDSDADGCRS